jgi:hypothetical protein
VLPDVEVRVIHPPRAVEVERHGREPPPQPGQRIESGRDVLAHLGEP